MNVKLMFAIAFDFDTEKLKKNYPGPSWQNAYGEVRKFLADKGFKNQQGSVYYGDDTVTQTTAVLAAVELSREYSYIRDSIEDIRILALIRADDLRPALKTGNPN